MDATDLFPRESVLSVESTEGCPCALVLGGGYRLTVEGLWRLRDNGAVVLTSQDNGQRFGHTDPIDAISQLSAALSGASITSVMIAPGSNDLRS